VSGEYRVAIIGCGGRGRTHWHAYRSTGRCRLVAVSDVVRDSAEALAKAAAEAQGAGVPVAVYDDYAAMLREAHPDIVSVCTWPALHAPMVQAAVEAGARAIHCEKPMAPTWGEARRMAELARRHGVLLMFCHQRRFAAPFRAARRLLREGAIGRLQRVECTCDNLFDWGTHWFDMIHYYNGEEPARWVLGQVEVGAGRQVFGAPVEEQGLSLVQFANGVQGLLITGHGRPWPEVNRLVGTDGVIEVQMPGGDGRWIPLRLRGQGDRYWRIPEITAADRPGPGGPEGDATADLLRCLEQGGEPELGAARALRATELIFASYESHRRGRRIELPLQNEGAALPTPPAAGPGPAAGA
jgi:UDP-N-acetylglucosamine 3-dehydrogenase